MGNFVDDDDDDDDDEILKNGVLPCPSSTYHWSTSMQLPSTYMFDQLPSSGQHRPALFYTIACLRPPQSVIRIDSGSCHLSDSNTKTSLRLSINLEKQHT